MRTLVQVLALITLSTSLAFGGTVISFTDQLVTPYGKDVRTQTETPNPALSVSVADNLNHTLTLSSVQASSTAPIIYMSMDYTGTGSCYVRLMSTSTRASWAQYTVPSGTTKGWGIHPNTLFVHYSSCQ